MYAYSCQAFNIIIHNNTTHWPLLYQNNDILIIPILNILIHTRVLQNRYSKFKSVYYILF